MIAKFKNAGLCSAKAAKKDDFFTTPEMIEAEMPFYEPFFRGKTVYCNCDDLSSAFWLFFHGNFARLGLKALWATCLTKNGPASLFSFNGLSVSETILSGNGDFRSPECAMLLGEADVCVTNPPFSLFREFIRLVMASGKKFLLVGNMNTLCCAEVFPLFMENRLWYGPSIHSGDRKFHVPDDYPLDAAGRGIDEKGRFVRVKGVRWLTNIDHGVVPPFLDTGVKYDPRTHPKYDNRDAVNVDRVKDIPMDYPGEMGVPVSFLDKRNPDQFEITGFRKGDDGKDLRIKGRRPYFRILVKARAPFRNQA